jgi:hypothetical protein
MATVVANPNTLGEVISFCQANFGDPNGRLITRAYALPIINQQYIEMRNCIKNASGKNLEAVIEVLNIPVGTTSLYPYQNPGNPSANPPTQRGPLAGLYDPIRMWVKTAGQLPQYYTPARERDTLPHVNPPGITPGTYAVQVTFAWIGNKLSITPVAGPIDIQLYGRFNPPRLVQDTDELVLYGDMSSTLALMSSAHMGVERSNPSILAGYATQGAAGIDNIVADIIRQTSRNPRRLAKMGGCGGTSWGWC